jgi:extracellular elastinolytic metalloproteinase
VLATKEESVKHRPITRRPLGTRALRPAILVALAALALALPPIGSSYVYIEGVTNDQLPDFDSRDDAAPTADQVALAGTAAVGARITWNSLGTPGSMIRYGGYLATGIHAPSAAAAARAYVASRRGLFRLGSTTQLRVANASRLVGTTDDYAVVFRQTFGGLASADGSLSVGVTGSKQAGWRITFLSSTLAPGGNVLRGSRTLSALAAWVRAATFTGRRPSVLDVRSAGNAAGATLVRALGYDGVETVRPTAFGTAHRGALRAYEAVVSKTVRGVQTSYDVIVDAQTGRLLYRQSLVDYLADNPTWLAYPIAPQTSPINRFPWNYPVNDKRELYCWTAFDHCKNVASDTGVVYPMGAASKFPWDVQLDSAGVDLGTMQTTGNNVDDARVWSGGHGAFGNPALVRATSPTRDYQPAFTDTWYTSGCDPSVLTGTGNDIEAATAALFVGHNQMHDYAYYLGFDEGHWNAQQYNNGVTAADSSPTPGGPIRDPVLANDGLNGNSQSGAITGSRDNANMSTGGDGAHPQTNMFLWQSLPGSFYAPCVDGDYDFSVFGHEYGHLIENRMIGKGVGARQGTHAGAMGEAFGDFDALEYLNEAHVAPVRGSDKWTEGAYVTGNHYNGIRDFLASEPMGGDLPEPGKNPKTDPLNLGDYGFDLTGPEVHADGEIWVAVQYDIRDLMLDRYKAKGEKLDLQCLHGQLSADQCPGDRRWIQLYYDSMVMMPRNTTILQARDAMLAADVARFGGANQDILWQAFAQRGFGQNASVTANNDTDPVPDFSSPLATNATLDFTAVSEDTGAPVDATIYVGDYQARVTPIADTDPGTSGPNLDATADFVPTDGPGSLAKGPRYDTYNFYANAPGYGHVRFTVKNLKPGETRNVTIEFPTNFASSAQGGVATGDALGTNVNLGNLIDDNEATNWGATGAPVQGRWVVVALAGGSTPVKFKRVNVSALLTSANNRFTALRAFEVYACTAGANAANPGCDGAIADGWKRILKSQDDAFPSVNPRPVAPDMTLRSWNVPDTKATHVKFVVVDNQCTGQASYHGDQDNDPNVNADCAAGTGTPRNTDVRAAELQVLSDKPKVEGKDVKTG